MDAVDRMIIARLQGGFPISPRPFAAVARELGLEEEELLGRLREMRARGDLTRFGPLFDVERMGGRFLLCAMAVPEERFEEVADIVNAFPEVAHNYERAHRFNMWFVLACARPERIEEVVRAIERRTGLEVLRLPRERTYFLELRLEP